ncbi:ABC transporter substrate-binding protein [Pseudomonas agarici]|uniref:ABC transporter substrate-binding protein n=2 Tax=Pseudomonas agarici TaxID=46677 RepID=UPI0008B8715C|nr:ABC transporter substrate-binding protein [Pseudomonas agarici]NWB92997.1 ABC transporter substrate-binding protein [Pseudomonas agarici]NWC09264.1 ABC transporter substrate-binding protein [Pseudomonas agarici]SEK30055.1 amino acid/amide ABC transporter substrate-binding protein, HAAT family [Pseudomonas agarici]
MKKLTAFALLSVLTFSVQAADSVKVGFISTLSGPIAGFGLEIRDGFNLALKNNGNKIGGLPVEVVEGDDQASPDVGKQLADKMIKRDKVDFLTGIVYSNVMLAVGPSAFAAKTFYISAAAGPAALAGERCNKYFFGLSWQNDGQSEAAGSYMSNKNYKKVFILAPNYTGGKENLEGFKRFFKGEISSEVYVKLGQLDFASELAQIRSSKPDAVFFFLPSGMSINFIKQYVGAGLDKEIPYFSTGHSADEDVVTAVGEQMVGLKNASHWAWDLKNPQNEAFVADFKKTYGRIPTMYAFQGYDVVRLLDSAVKDVKGNLSDKEALHAALMTTDFKSLRGNFKFNTNQFPMDSFYLREVKKDSAGTVTNKTVETIFDNHSDAYVGGCKL